MVDADLATKKLAELSQRIARIREVQRTSPEELGADRDALDLTSFNLLLAIQSCLDLASHLIADEEWEPATSLGASFLRLAEHGVISQESAHSLKQAAGMRNLIAHGYASVDPVQIYDAAENGVTDLERFAREVGAWVKERLSY